MLNVLALQKAELYELQDQPTCSSASLICTIASLASTGGCKPA
jgi:hypothetical protein